MNFMFYPGEEPWYPWLAGWVNPGASVDILEKRKICCSYWDSKPVPSSSSVVRINF